MSKNYCLIKDDRIVEGPMVLPVNYGNTSNLPALSDEELVNIGWIKVVYPKDVADRSLQVKEPDTYNINKDYVEVVFHYRGKTTEELAAELEPKTLELNDMESIQYIRKFLKDKFNNDELFPKELK